MLTSAHKRFLLIYPVLISLYSLVNYLENSLLQYGLASNFITFIELVPFVILLKLLLHFHRRSFSDFIPSFSDNMIPSFLFTSITLFNVIAKGYSTQRFYSFYSSFIILSTLIIGHFFFKASFKFSILSYSPLLLLIPGTFLFCHFEGRVDLFASVARILMTCCIPIFCFISPFKNSFTDFLSFLHVSALYFLAIFVPSLLSFPTLFVMIQVPSLSFLCTVILLSIVYPLFVFVLVINSRLLVPAGMCLVWGFLPVVHHFICLALNKCPFRGWEWGGLGFYVPVFMFYIVVSYRFPSLDLTFFLASSPIMIE
ncbi:hypothetical protein RCL1_006166 [Eukaryota sp. TZLM3-RCL]